MHGIILAELQMFVEAKLGHAAWEALLVRAGVGSKVYDHDHAYTDEEALSLIAAAVELTSIPRDALLRDFGEFLAPALMRLWRVLIQPGWRTLDVIENVEGTIHRVVRARRPDADPPEIRCAREAPDRATIRYGSKRRLCPVVRGIVAGLASHYGETITIDEPVCMLRGDPACELRLALASSGSSVHAAETLVGSVSDLAGGSSSLGDIIGRSGPGGGAGSVPGAGITLAGRYELRGELGRGGMGVVLRARDTELDRDVAVKILKTDAGSGEAVERFRREAQAAARLDHPGIIDIYDVGEHEGLPYFVMAFAEGETLDAWRADRPTAEVVRAVRDVALAIEHAHGEGVIHRDIKPLNVIIGPTGQPIVMDFGLAWDATAATRLTQTGQILGTPDYMAPEQFDGIPGLLGAHTDVWALGALLFFALAGQPPFAAATIPAIVKSVLVDDPPTLAEIGYPADPSLEKVIAACLEKDSANRPDSAAALADDLDRFTQ